MNELPSSVDSELFCDESGNTGPALLDPEQRYFSFSSVSISEAEAASIIQEARKRFPVQMPELKSSKLLRSSQGRRLCGHILNSVTGRYAVSIHDKVFALCAHFFEYVIEPVFRDQPQVLYAKGMHRFTAMVLYVWSKASEPDARETLDQLQVYLRTLDPEQAPSLFSHIQGLESPNRDPFDSLLRFARACRKTILIDNEDIPRALPEQGVWLGDLATTSLWCHLNHWGRRGYPIALTCDESKPLSAYLPHLNGTATDPGILMARRRGHLDAIGWKFSRPPLLRDSKEAAGLQIADVLAGIAAHLFREDLEGSSEMDIFRKSMADHCLSNCMLPDFAYVDPTLREPAVNAAVLYRLSEKAEAARNLLEGLERDYLFAEAQWDAGRYRLT